MSILIKKVICNKNLVNQKNQQDFTKGKFYEVTNQCYNLEYATVIDDQKDIHCIGHWFTHFTICKT